jgi:large subunit ribosomal protein L31
MKKGLHPELKKCTITCVCGATFETLSNQESHNVETCSKCHPFYTGMQGKHKKTGSVEKFNKKYNLN